MALGLTGLTPEAALSTMRVSATAELYDKAVSSLFCSRKLYIPFLIVCCRLISTNPLSFCGNFFRTEAYWLLVLARLPFPASRFLRRLWIFSRILGFILSISFLIDRSRGLFSA